MLLCYLTQALLALSDPPGDVVTTPTLSMLAATIQTTLLDDVFRADPTTNALEVYLSHLTGKPAALLALSGTMANQLALRSHLGGPPHSILTDHRAHILEWEAGGAASLCGALIRGVVPANGHMLTFDEVVGEAKVGIEGEDVHACPTRVVSLENTLGGEILDFAEAEKIFKWSREHDVRVHCDGARLWEAVAAQVAAGMWEGDLTKGLKAWCGLFDSVSLCFSKGLGAPVGSILVGEEVFIKKARHVRKSIGGGLRQVSALRVLISANDIGGIDHCSVQNSH